MALTIHYGLSSSALSLAKAKALVEQMRELALDLPFERVDEQVQHLGPDVCQRPLDELRSDEDLYYSVLDGCQYRVLPWYRKKWQKVKVQPLDVLSFWTDPGLGSESASFGLARYPAEMEITYHPREDDQFIKPIDGGFLTCWEFDWQRWEEWLEAKGYDRWEHPDKFQEKRLVKTGQRPGWRYAAPCTTQYASNPKYGGVANFVKCHLCVIHLLDQIARLPTMTVLMNDEGKYGRSYHVDDPAKPVHRWHEGKYDVEALAKEVVGWNEMIAAEWGALNDLLPACQSPITAFPNFEQLEFRGIQCFDTLFADLRKLAEEEKKKRKAE